MRGTIRFQRFGVSAFPNKSPPEQWWGPLRGEGREEARSPARGPGWNQKAMKSAVRNDQDRPLRPLGTPGVSSSVPARSVQVRSIHSPSVMVGKFRRPSSLMVVGRSRSEGPVAVRNTRSPQLQPMELPQFKHL